MSDYRPDYYVGEGGIPRCSHDKCPAYDGKRCGLIGFRPPSICEPAVRDLLAIAQAAGRVAAELEREVKHLETACMRDGRPTCLSLGVQPPALCANCLAAWERRELCRPLRTALSAPLPARPRDHGEGGE